MPRNEASRQQNEVVALSLPEDIRQDLLRAQQESIETPQRLPEIRVMPSGVGLFEFKDTNETAREFEAIILANNPTNVLWDKPYGAPAATEADKFPACSSVDGVVGIPRQGFFHAALGREADGTEQILCRTCPYNQFGTGNMLIPTQNPRGKAVTNYRSVYVLVEGRLAPMELKLPSTSIRSFDDYLTRLSNRGIPAPAVLTKVWQVVEEKGGNRRGVAKFEMIRTLDQETFDHVMQIRSQYSAAIFPTSISAPTAPAMEESEIDNETNLPF